MAHSIIFSNFLKTGKAMVVGGGGGERGCYNTHTIMHAKNKEEISSS